MGSRRWSAPSTVQDTANIARFLASELGSFVTGLYIPVCGGQVME
jgi:NAD(P)-dependent dehydrogenase (short-subunit alcohol dehydrogenase family)